MTKFGPMSMRHAKFVGKNGSSGAFATTQGTMRPSEAVTPWRCLQQGLAATRLARGGGVVGYDQDAYGSLDVAEEEEKEVTESLCS